MGNWLLQTRVKTEQIANHLLQLHSDGEVNKAFALSQRVKQHFGHVNKYSLIINLVTPGHSEDKGRTEKHLFWEIIDMDNQLKEEVNRRISNIPSFPGLKFCGRSLNSKTKFTELVLKGSKLSADEIRSVRSFIIFCLVGLVSEKRLKCWYFHIAYASGYHTIEWTTQKRIRWNSLRYKFLQSFQQEFKTKSKFEFPKFHDPGT